MLKEIFFWAEFPEKVDWNTLSRLLREVDLRVKVFVTCKSLYEFKKIKAKIKLGHINLGAWPILDLDEGYWFSGFTKRKEIDKLRYFKDCDIKIDLEPPISNWEYSNLRIYLYGIKLIFSKGKNNDYLKQTIYDVAKVNKNNIFIVNEFPLWTWYLRRQGIYIDKLEKNMIKNIMSYTSIIGWPLKPLIKNYLRSYTKKTIKKYGIDKIMFSIGLIGPGILKKEGTYKSLSEFKEDLEMIIDSGAQRVVIYSIESLLKKENAREWLELIKSYINNH